jgi:small subunit ribosomal protein S5
VRAVVEAAGYHNILSKSLGSNNVLNVMKATIDGLHQLKEMRQEAEDRGKDIIDVAPFWSRNQWRS